jgi:hypothetical protein
MLLLGQAYSWMRLPWTKVGISESPQKARSLNLLSVLWLPFKWNTLQRRFCVWSIVRSSALHAIDAKWVASFCKPALFFVESKPYHAVAVHWEDLDAEDMSNSFATQTVNNPRLPIKVMRWLTTKKSARGICITIFIKYWHIGICKWPSSSLW